MDRANGVRGRSPTVVDMEDFPDLENQMGNKKISDIARRELSLSCNPEARISCCTGVMIFAGTAAIAGIISLFLKMAALGGAFTD